MLQQYLIITEYGQTGDSAMITNKPFDYIKSNLKYPQRLFKYDLKKIEGLLEECEIKILPKNEK